jgi:hypothetical protein
MTHAHSAGLRSPASSRYERCASTIGPSSIANLAEELRSANTIGCEGIVKIVEEICEHNRVRGMRQDCGGAAICAHTAIERMCWKCHRFRLQQEEVKEKDDADTGMRTRA